VSSPRPIRIPRPASRGTAAPGSIVQPGEAAPLGPVRERRVNRGGTQRAVRLTIVYLVCLAALYLAFAVLDRTVPGGTSSPAGNGFDTFSVLAVLLAVGGTVVSLHPAPRWVEVSPLSTVVVGRWGRRHTYPPPDRLETRAVRRYPAGLLSTVPVVSVELSGGPSPLATFLLEEGIVPMAASSR
jgi:hypothetical protein